MRERACTCKRNHALVDVDNTQCAGCEWGSYTTKFVGGATLVDAFYEAHRIEPDNAYVKQAIDDGITIMEFVKDTPMEVLLYLKGAHNGFHSGSSFTVLEMYPSLSSICVS